MIDRNLDQIVTDICDDLLSAFRGTMDMSQLRDYVLTLFLFKFLSDISDKMQEYAHITIPEEVRFSKIYLSADNSGIGERLDYALQIIESNNNGSLSIDVSFTSHKLGDQSSRDKQLWKLLSVLNEFNFSQDKALAKSIFEYMIYLFATQSGKKGGIDNTPNEVSELLAQLTEPQVRESIYDPACGTGSLLIKCAEYIRESDKGTYFYSLYGQELSGSTWAIARQNMLIHEEFDTDIRLGNTILEPHHTISGNELRRFDVVVCNPPFSLKDWGHEFASHDPYHRFYRGVPPKTQGDYAFICHMIESLKPVSGRLAVVVPHGALFRASGEKHIRQKLIEEGLLDAVIGLPPKLFFGTNIPAAILIFRRHKCESNVIFIDASKNYQSGKIQNSLTKDGIKKILQGYKNRSDIAKFSRAVSIEEIIDNEYNLNIPRYIDISNEREELDLSVLQEDRCMLQKKLVLLDKNMQDYLGEN